MFSGYLPFTSVKNLRVLLAYGRQKLHSTTARVSKQTGFQRANETSLSESVAQTGPQNLPGYSLSDKVPPSSPPPQRRWIIR